MEATGTSRSTFMTTNKESALAKDVSQMLMIKTARLANRVRRVEKGDQSSSIPMLPQTREEFKAVYEKHIELNLGGRETWPSLAFRDVQDVVSKKWIKVDGKMVQVRHLQPWDPLLCSVDKLIKVKLDRSETPPKPIPGSDFLSRLSRRDAASLDPARIRDDLAHLCQEINRSPPSEKSALVEHWDRVFADFPKYSFARTASPTPR